MHITLVRHGESVANLEGRWQGQGDAPLSDRGKQQAAAVGKRLSERTFDLVVSSDLQRARHTAEAVGVAYETDKAFREFDVGAWEGLTREEVQRRFPEELEGLAHGGPSVRIGGGESHLEFSERVDEALGRLRGRVADDARVLLVCHGGVVGALLAGALDLRRHGNWPFTRIRNTAVCELEFRDDGVVLEAFNDAAHLSTLPEVGYLEQPDATVVSLCAAHDDEVPEWASEWADHLPTGGADSAERAEVEQLRSLQAEGAGPVRRAEATEVLVRSMATQHPGARVGVTVTPSTLQAWVARTVWRNETPAGSVSEPTAGSLCHAVHTGTTTLMLDFNVHPYR